MTNVYIGIREFRNNLASFSKKAWKKQQRIIVVKNDQPMFELIPIDPKKAAKVKLLMAIERAEKDIRDGRTYSSEEVAKMLGL